MHYNNVFLVNADNKINAIERVVAFLEQFHEREWDWYQFGGRWMWSDLVKKNIAKIIKPNTGCYWNPYHDPKVKGKTWTMVFPDGTKKKLQYGTDYEIMEWVHTHPEQSEVIDATNPNFWKILKNLPKLEKEILKEARKSLELWKKKKDKDMIKWAKKRLDEFENQSHWVADLGFWNISISDFGYNGEEIKKEPNKWFLVNVDLHN